MEIIWYNLLQFFFPSIIIKYWRRPMSERRIKHERQKSQKLEAACFKYNNLLTPYTVYIALWTIRQTLTPCILTLLALCVCAFSFISFPRHIENKGTRLNANHPSDAIHFLTSSSHAENRLQRRRKNNNRKPFPFRTLLVGKRIVYKRRK